jgi:GT2 family glycosyltransferase
VVPAYNEEGSIRDCLDSLRAQDYPALSIIVVDGRSSDQTRAIVEQIGDADGRVRLLDNPNRTAAAAMNVGLQASTTELLVRADAHALYWRDFVSTSVDVLLETGADNVGGPMRPVGTTRFGRAVAAVTSSRVGMGSGAFHWAVRRREVDTVYLGCYRIETLTALDGWDENLQWGAEDQELNFRLRLRGGKVMVDPAIRSWYFTRSTPRALWRQYYNYGVCKVSTLVKHGRLPTRRPLAPAALVLSLAIGLPVAVARRHPLSALPAGAWAAAIGVVAARMGREPGVDRTRAALAFATCHVGYGVGFWAGVLRVVTGRGFDTRPRGHR